VRRSTSRCSAQSRTTSPAGRHNCGIGSSSQLATVIGAMNAGPRARPLGVCEVESARIGCRSHRSTRGCPGRSTEVSGHRHPFRGRSLELRERRAGTSLGPSRTPYRRRPQRPTAQAVPGDEDRQCVGPIGSQSARQTPQPFVQLSEPTPTVCGLGALLPIRYRTTLRSRELRIRRSRRSGRSRGCRPGPTWSSTRCIEIGPAWANSGCGQRSRFNVRGRQIFP
jgi:hypothetical protein